MSSAKLHSWLSGKIHWKLYILWFYVYLTKLRVDPSKKFLNRSTKSTKNAFVVKYPPFTRFCLLSFKNLYYCTDVMFTYSYQEVIFIAFKFLFFSFPLTHVVHRFIIFISNSIFYHINVLMLPWWLNLSIWGIWLVSGFFTISSTDIKNSFKKSLFFLPQSGIKSSIPRLLFRKIFLIRSTIAMFECLFTNFLDFSHFTFDSRENFYLIIVLNSFFLIISEARNFPKCLFTFCIFCYLHLLAIYLSRKGNWYFIFLSVPYIL